jgi:hypothetical protein
MRSVTLIEALSNCHEQGAEFTYSPGRPTFALFMGDTLVLDRWNWLVSSLWPGPASLIDVGCGNGWLAPTAVGWVTRRWGSAGMDRI